METTCVGIGDGFAECLYLSDDGAVADYRFTYTVTKSKLSDSAAATIDITLSEENVKAATSNHSIFGQQRLGASFSLANIDASDVIARIRTRPTVLREQVTAVRQSYFATKSLAIPELLASFNSAVGYELVASTNVKPGYRNTIASVIATSGSSRVSDDRTAQQLSKKLLFESGVDVGSRLSQPTYGKPTLSQRANATTSQGQRQTYEQYNELADVQNRLIVAASGNPTPTHSSPSYFAYRYADRDAVSVYTDLSQIRVPTGLMPGFYVTITIKTADGVLVQELTKYVDHAACVRSLRAATQAPTIVATRLGDEMGKVRLTVQQTDRYATDIKIYKQTYRSSDSVPPQVYVTSLAVRPNAVASLVLDEPETLIPGTVVLYKAVAGTELKFGSSVITPVGKASDMRADRSTIAATVVDGGVRLSITDIPTGVAAVALYRQRDGDVERSIVQRFLVNGMGGSVSYVDTTVEAESAYHYTIAMTDMLGNNVPTYTEELLVYRPPTASVYATVTVGVSTVTTDTDLTTGKPRYDVVFDVGYLKNETAEDVTRKLLKNQQLIEYYGADINRQNLSQLLVTRVTMKNLLTGDHSDLGFIDQSTGFVQSKTRVGYITEPAAYRYELTTYVRDPATLLPRVVLTGSSTPRPGSGTTQGTLTTTYTYTPAISSNPFSLLTGTMAKKSGSEYESMTGVSEMSLGPVVDVQYVTVDVTQPKPTVQGLRAYRSSRTTITLSWSVNGQQDQIGHFVVARQDKNTGAVDHMGTANGIEPTNSYAFVDRLRAMDPGRYVYYVTPQLTDYSVGSSYASNEVEVSVEQ